MQKQISQSRILLQIQRIISIVVISVISFVGLEALVYINNLYEEALYIRLSVYLYIFLIAWLYFLFDLHYKHTIAISTEQGMWRSIRQRFHYLGEFEHIRKFLNFLILPAVLYWGAVVLIGINFYHIGIQQFVAVTASFGLVLSYVVFKEVFRTRALPTATWHFVIISYVKVFAAWIGYASALGIVWYYCLPTSAFYVLVFLLSFSLLYQALFQFHVITAKNVLWTILISVGMSCISVIVFNNWNVNYFTAGIFLAAIYNFCWSMLIQKLKQRLTLSAAIQNLVLLLIIVAFVFGVTNFHERIDRCV